MAAEVFIANFTRAYRAELYPRFLPCSYREALQQAQQESKFLLTYLHSGLHEVRLQRFPRALELSPLRARPPSALMCFARPRLLPS